MPKKKFTQFVAVTFPPDSSFLKPPHEPPQQKPTPLNTGEIATGRLSSAYAPVE
jgi:hypothetical protein